MADSGVQTLRARIEAVIETSGDNVVAKVVGAAVDTEIKRRADLLTAGVNAMRQLETDLRKIQPDHKMVNADGTVLSEGFTVGKQKELAAHKDKMARLDQAITTVLDKHDADSYSKLDQAIKKMSSKGGGADSETA
jgi:Skp family chaperone for outer membrane proteins